MFLGIMAFELRLKSDILFFWHLFVPFRSFSFLHFPTCEFMLFMLLRIASHCFALLGSEATWQLSGSLKLSVPLELQA